MNKIIKIVFLLILIGIVVILGYGKYKTYRTSYDMSTDEENAVITGIWDEENLNRYKYLAIPDTDYKVKNLGTMKYPYSNVTEIGKNAFQGNTYIESVYIPVNIVKIRSNAFKGCTSIQSISYAGTEQQWKQIVVEAGNEVLTTIPVKYNAKMP